VKKESGSLNERRSAEQWMSAGRLFQAWGPATAKSHSLNIERLIGGTNSLAVEVESCRR